jgi:hypothetical protein
MGNELSLLHTLDQVNQIQEEAAYQVDPDTPSSLFDCYDDNGDLDILLYAKYQQRSDQLDEAQDTSMYLINNLILEDLLFNQESQEVVPPKRKRKRGPKGVLFFTDETGAQRILPPTLSFWYNQYCSKEVRDRIDHSTKWLNKFRRRFRLPYNCYLQLVDMAISDRDHFLRWKPGNTDATGKECAPIHLLVLTSLQYLGRGWTFDDLEEATAISEPVIRQFFHEFILFGTRSLYPRYDIVLQVIGFANRHILLTPMSLYSL